MQARARALVLASMGLASVALAGCSGGGASHGGTEASIVAPSAGTQAMDETNRTRPSPAPVTLAASDCQLHAHNFPVPATEVAPFLPDGFTANPYQGLDPSMVTAVVVASRCTALGNGTEELGPHAETVFYLGVTPTQDWMAQDIGAYRLVLAHATDSAAIVSTFSAWNLTVSAGAEVDLGFTDLGPGRMTIDVVSGPYTLDARGQGAGDQAFASTAGLLRFIYVRDGRPVGAVDRELNGNGRGLFGANEIQLSGAPLGNGAHVGNTGFYDWSGMPAFTVQRV